MAGQVEGRRKKLGIGPVPSAPGANYVAFVRTGDLVFLTGQLSQWNGERGFIGKLGHDYRSPMIDRGEDAGDGRGAQAFRRPG